MATTTLLFELEPELIDWRWQSLTQLAPGEELLMGLYRYLLDYDNYELDEAFLTYLKSDQMWFMLSEWADDAFMLWSVRIDALKCEYHDTLQTVGYDPRSHTYWLTFKEV